MMGINAVDDDGADVGVVEEEEGRNKRKKAR